MANVAPLSPTRSPPVEFNVQLIWHSAITLHIRRILGNWCMVEHLLESSGFSSSPMFHGLLQCLPESTSHRHTLVFAACVIPRILSVIVSVFTDTCGSGSPSISRTIRGSFAVNFSTMARSVVIWIEGSRAFIFIRKRRWQLNLQPNKLSRVLFLLEPTRHWNRSKVCSLSARDPGPASANTAKIN